MENAVVRFLVKRGFDVYHEVPAKRPQSFVTVERVGGGDNNIATSSVMLAIQCWAPTRNEAAELCESVKKSARDLSAVPNINGVKISGHAWFPDERGNARYQLTTELTVNN